MGSLRENFVTLHFPYIAIQMRYQQHSSGQPNCTVFTSSPMVFLSVAGRPRNHSRTGSLPESVLKKRISKVGMFHVVNASILVRYSKPFAQRGLLRYWLDGDGTLVKVQPCCYVLRREERVN